MDLKDRVERLLAEMDRCGGVEDHALLRETLTLLRGDRVALGKRRSDGDETVERQQEIERLTRQLEERAQRAEAAERIYRRLAESNLFGVGFGDTRGNVTFVNDEMLRMMGRTRAEFEAGQINWARCLVPEDPSIQERLSATLLRDGYVGGYERAFLRPDGGRTPFVAAAAVVYPGNDFHVSIALDLTTIRQTETALREREQRLRLALDAAELGTWTYTFENNRWELDERAQRLYGIDVPETIHDETHLKGVLFDEDCPAMWAAVRRACDPAGPGRYEAEYRIHTPDGGFRWLKAWAQVEFTLIDGQRKPVRMIGASRDITASKQAESARRESEERFRVALSSAPASVYANDADLRYTWVHGPRLGFTVEQMLGKRDDELLPCESVAELIAVKRRVLATGQRERVQISTTIDGQEYAFDITVEPQRDSADKTVGLIVATYEITELVKAKRNAELASHAKDHFLAVLSHELRTPLTPALAMAQTLEADPHLPADHREMVQVIRRGVELEARLIDDLLDLTRIARGKIELQLETVDLHDAIRQALNTCGEEITAKRLDVVLRLNAPHHHARVDSARVQQIIWNLVRNATKFTPAGGRITLATASEPDGSVCIEVRDTGIGIAPEALPRIFDAFEQGGSEVTRQFGGLGLGLAISKALVNLHGGTISATSEGKGSGARFVVHLPTTVKPADMQAGVVPPTTRAIACSILLVDDHADTRQTMARILRSLGCQVQTAGTVAEALTLAARQAFDLLISDIGLPDASGNELMRQVRRTYGFTGVALSGYGMDEDIARSRDAGFAAHLTKPVNLRLLEETVRRLAPAR